MSPRWFSLRVVTLLAVSSNLVLVYFIHQLQLELLQCPDVVRRAEERANGHVAFVYAELHPYETHILETISFVELRHPSVPVLIVSDAWSANSHGMPRLFSAKERGLNAKVIVLEHVLGDSHTTLDEVITSHWLLLLPEDVVPDGRLQVALSDQVLVFPLDSDSATPCAHVSVDLRRWTLSHSSANDSLPCNYFEGRVAILMPRQVLLDLWFPFQRPVFPSLFIQLAMKHIPVQLSDQVPLVHLRPAASSLSARLRESLRLQEELSSLYPKLGLKSVLDSSRHERHFGCDRETPRCFASIRDDRPDYWYLGRWTPPCCLHGLRETARHVFQVLEEAGVRYWLEGGSLLGAARDGDIIPWDYDVDLGTYWDDVDKCQPLQRAHQDGHFVDSAGYVWERAVEGEFFRVQWSAVNRLHIDIFPFFARNGTMTKNTWFAGHPQDCEFAESFLRPLAQLPFVGRMASVPNEVRLFLELKFGPGCIDTPTPPQVDSHDDPVFVR